MWITFTRDKIRFENIISACFIVIMVKVNFFSLLVSQKRKTLYRCSQLINELQLPTSDTGTDFSHSSIPFGD